MTYQEAIDQILGKLKAVVEAESTNILGYIPQIVWPGIVPEDTPAQDKFWIKVSIHTTGESQGSFRSGTSGKTFENTGLVYIQVLFPVAMVNASILARGIGIKIRNTYRGNSPRGGVWYRNTVLKDSYPQQNWGAFIVTTDYTYTEHT